MAKMKKLLAISLALALLLSTSIVVFANDVDYGAQWGDGPGGSATIPLFEIDTDSCDAYYYAGQTYELVLKVQNIDLSTISVGGVGMSDGLSMVAFDLVYDSSLITPAFSAVADSEDDVCDITALLTGSTTGWVGFGAEIEGGYSFMFYDDSTQATGAYKGKYTLNPVSADNVIVLTIPFTVSSDVSSEVIEIGIESVYGSNRDWTKSFFGGTASGLALEDGSALVQPDDPVTLPAGAGIINVAGYKHQGGITVLLATDVDTTIGELTAKGDSATLGDEIGDMNYWGVIVCDASGKVIYTNNTLGRPAGVKTDVEVPAGGFVIGINAGSTVVANTELGSTVTLYNINLSAVAVLNGNTELTSAGYTIIAPIQPTEKDELPAGAHTIKYAGYAHEGGASVIMIADSDTTIGELVLKGDSATLAGEAPDMNYWEVIVTDADGKVINVLTTLGRPDGVKTDIEVPAGGIVIGYHGPNFPVDVAEGDSIVLYNLNASSIAALEGHEPLDKGAFAVVPAAPDVLKGDVNLDGSVNQTDYLMLKRYCLGTYTLGDDNLAAADINGDGDITQTDYLMLKRYCLGTYDIYA